ncbi:MAG TPA: FAD-dependent oxidoreductase, partial [Humisphaera sp.]
RPSAIGVRQWVPPLPQVHCWIGATNEAIHQLIRANLHRAPMYSGQIEGTGPRYCPSIEDKVVRFADKGSHHVFLEPEGLDTNEIYCNGISTSLPADVQEAIVRLMPGLESARILRHGYAVEYDMVWPTQIRSTLETKAIRGLFLAGQINGTSGYEEAAAQGLVAGVNAALHAAGKLADFVLGRDEAYIGVLVDDLVTKPPIEPYRMFTSRAEHRLHLRADNADQRLTEKGRRLGLVDDARWAGFTARREAVAAGVALLKKLRFEGEAAYDRLRRPDATWADIAGRSPELAAIDPAIGRLIEVEAKYSGYLTKQARDVERMGQLEQKLIPPTIDYAAVSGLRNEARQKLMKFTPRSLGQALRISGITPADVTVLAIHLARRGPPRNDE